MLAERTASMIPKYKQMFVDRGGVTPTDPIKFHFYHLALYWSRLVGFCRQNPEKPEVWIDGDLGACVQVGSDFANDLINANSPIYNSWKEYRQREQSILHKRPVSITEIESTSKSFDECLAALNYNPWDK
jgi:hypothetical protein